jgi:predicted enzyme related to lactoylglutathione lyase
MSTTTQSTSTPVTAEKAAGGMTVGFVRVFVADFDRALSFYTSTLGLELDYTDRKGWAQFVTGPEVALAIEACAPDRIVHGSRLVGRYVGVTLMVDDVAAQYARLTKAGVAFSGPPEAQPFGGIMAHLHDPDGNVLTLMQEAR